MIDEVKTNYVRVINKYADFSGRASRKEFWLFVLVNFIIQLVLGLGVLGVWFLTMTALNLSIVMTLFALATLLPSIAVSVRRLHDIDRTGWWKLMGFVPVAGSITLLVFYCLPGSADENRFGAKPKGIGSDPELTPEQAERALENLVNKLKQTCTESIAAEKQTEAELQKKMQEHETLEKRATQAVNNNDDDLARQCLAKKLEANLAIQALTAQLQSQRETSTSLKSKYAEMQEQLRIFRLRKSNLDTRSQSASSQEMGNKTYSSSAMDRFEEQMRKTEALNEARREMEQAKSAASASSADKFSDLDDELAAMKRSLASKQDE